MTGKIILYIFAFIALKGFSQSLEFIDLPFQKSKYSNELYHLNSLTDSSTIEYIGKLKVTYNSDKLDVQKLFKVFKKIVLNAGANYYSEYNYFKTDTNIIVYYNLYYFREQDFINKNELANTNKIYVFGEFKKNESINFKANDTRINLPFASYYKAELKKESKLKINKGSITGETRFYKWKQNKQAVFLSFHDLGINPLPTNIALEISFNTGRFYDIDSSYAVFLSSLFKQIN